MELDKLSEVEILSLLRDKQRLLAQLQEDAKQLNVELNRRVDLHVKPKVDGTSKFGGPKK